MQKYTKGSYTDILDEASNIETYLVKDLRVMAKRRGITVGKKNKNDLFTEIKNLDIFKKKSHTKKSHTKKSPTKKSHTKKSPTKKSTSKKSTKKSSFDETSTMDEKSTLEDYIVKDLRSMANLRGIKVWNKNKKDLFTEIKNLDIANKKSPTKKSLSKKSTKRSIFDENSIMNEESTPEGYIVKDLRVMANLRGIKVWNKNKKDLFTEIKNLDIANKTSPPKKSPNKTSPPKKSPTKTSPPKKSPTKTSPPKTPSTKKYTKRSLADVNINMNEESKSTEYLLPDLRVMAEHRGIKVGKKHKEELFQEIKKIDTSDKKSIINRSDCVVVKTIEFIEKFNALVLYKIPAHHTIDDYTFEQLAKIAKAYGIFNQKMDKYTLFSKISSHKPSKVAL